MTTQPEQKRDWSLLEATQESLREHMAEVKRLQAIVDKYENGILNHFAEQPAPQENLQDLWHKVWPDAGAFVRVSADDLTQFAKAVSTSPQPAQPSKPWVGLTDVERKRAIQFNNAHEALAVVIEAKLREKNT